MNFLSWPAAAAFAVGWLVSSWHRLLGLLFLRVRVQPEAAGQFYRGLAAKPLRVLWAHEVTIGAGAGHPPANENRVLWIDRRVVWISSSEELLRAGFTPKQHTVQVSAFRWNSQWLVRLCEGLCEAEQAEPQVYFADPWQPENFGPLIPPPPHYVLPDAAREFVAACRKVVAGELNKTGAVLAGPPGNGKSSLVRYLCRELGVDLIAFNFEDDMKNRSVYSCFRHLVTRERPYIAVFEDFDVRYKGRDAHKADVKHSFDTILNALDGPYLHHTGTIFILTSNHLDRVDPALYRPGRFDFQIQLGDPSAEEIARIVPHASPADVAALSGLSRAEVAAFRGVRITDDNISAIRRQHRKPAHAEP